MGCFYDRHLNYFASRGYDQVVANEQRSHDGQDRDARRHSWSDGKPITAHDIEFSFKVIMSSAVPILAVAARDRSIPLGAGIRRSHGRDLPQGGVCHERRQPLESSRSFPNTSTRSRSPKIRRSHAAITTRRSKIIRSWAAPTSCVGVNGIRNSSSAAARTTTWTNGKQVRAEAVFQRDSRQGD